MRPLARLLTDRREDPDLVPPELQQAAADDRVPVDLAHGALQQAAEHFEDPQLGLELGAGLSLGELGPYDYLVRSAPTARHALEAADRYSSLQSDGYRIGCETWRGQRVIRLFDQASWPRVVADLSVTSTYRLHVAKPPRFSQRVECWFPQSAPSDQTAYERCLPGAVLKFGAPFHGLALDPSYALAPRPAADATLHTLLCQRMSTMLLQATSASSLPLRVQATIERQLREQRDVSAFTVSQSLRMNSRTLRRRLQQEGTTFVFELDRIRHKLSLEYVSDTQWSFAEVSYRLGFSHVESFYRAFKRWTGTTPRRHRSTALQTIAPTE
ncbi:MAG: AraC family transcriptional regulator ligand-binding domain-containing protein [Myxococcales bacterium]|nr:AraC family transcriptional regulator ligand-binding domain-containing protein [Myxococcales bacterium]